MFRAQLDTSTSLRSTSSISSVTGFTRRHQGNSVKRLILLLVVYVIYIVSGAFVFRQLEGGNEENLRKRIRAHMEDFLRNNSCVDSKDMLHLVDEVVYAVDNGLKDVVNDRDTTYEYGHHQWDVPNSLFFATTAITTIGKISIVMSKTRGKEIC